MRKLALVLGIIGALLLWTACSSATAPSDPPVRLTVPHVHFDTVKIGDTLTYIPPVSKDTIIFCALGVGHCPKLPTKPIKSSIDK